MNDNQGNKCFPITALPLCLKTGAWFHGKQNIIWRWNNKLEDGNSKMFQVIMSNTFKYYNIVLVNLNLKIITNSYG